MCLDYFQPCTVPFPCCSQQKKIQYKDNGVFQLIWIKIPIGRIVYPFAHLEIYPVKKYHRIPYRHRKTETGRHNSVVILRTILLSTERSALFVKKILYFILILKDVMSKIHLELFYQDSALIKLFLHLNNSLCKNIIISPCNQ